MKALVNYDEEKKIVHIAIRGTLSPIELYEFFIKTASLISKHARRQSLMVFQDEQAALPDTSQLITIFKGLGKLRMQKIALAGVPLLKCRTLHGIIESTKGSSNSFSHEFFGSESEAFSWLTRSRSPAYNSEHKRLTSRTEIEQLLNIGFPRNESEDISLRKEKKNLEKNPGFTESKKQ